MKSNESPSVWLSGDERERLERPVGESWGLPGRAYTDPGFLDLERRTLFRNTWVAAGVASALPDPGDVQPVDIAGWPLVLVRNRAGEINAFHNICRHRNTAVVSTAARRLPALRCPWHGWTYDLDGSLRGTPEFDGIGRHETAGLQRKRLSLVPVRTAQWFDIVFVNIDGRAPSLETHLAEFLRRFEGVRFDALQRANSWTTAYPCNWKLTVESGLESYHLPFLHPLTIGGSWRGEQSKMETDDIAYFCCGEVSRSQWAEGRGASDLPQLPSIPGLQGDDACSLFFLNLFPSAVIGMVPDSLYLGIWLPDGHAHTTLSFHHYFAGEGATAERYQPTRDNIIASLHEVFAQDVPVLQAAQIRAASRDELGIRPHFSPFWETLVHGFQKNVVRHIEARANPT